jgi:pimeloyl-ACP methyl ester carboxylesterase
MPGFGRADKPRDFPYSVAGYAEFLEDSGHWPFVDDPERTAQVVIPFLREQATSSPDKGARR